MEQADPADGGTDQEPGNAVALVQNTKNQIFFSTLSLPA